MTDILKSFLLKPGVWSGDFHNFVNQDQGIVQQGKIELQVELVDDNTAIQRTGFIRPDGSRTGYQGQAKIQVKGNRIENPQVPEKDENTGNPIKGYRFDGFAGQGHIHILEQYTEVHKDQPAEERRNEIHYCQLDEGQVLMISSVYVNGQLLVFARATLQHSP